MSARSNTAGDLPFPIFATMPGAATRLCSTPMASSSRATAADVSVSVHISSGFLCSSRRMPTT